MKSATGDYTLGFVVLALTAIIALVVQQIMGRSTGRREVDRAMVQAR